MTIFFQGQMDYIFFFYGLAFIGLGVVAYILAKEVNQRLPWSWLALFGLTHGVIDRGQYTVLVTVAILSAFVPTLLAQQFFKPNVAAHRQAERR